MVWFGGQRNKVLTMCLLKRWVLHLLTILCRTRAISKTELLWALLRLLGTWETENDLLGAAWSWTFNCYVLTWESIVYCRGNHSACGCWVQWSPKCVLLLVPNLIIVSLCTELDNIRLAQTAWSRLTFEDVKPGMPCLVHAWFQALNLSVLTCSQCICRV